MLRGVVSGGSPAPARPVVVARPWVTRKGHALTCHPGTWNNHPTSRAYRWSVAGDGTAVASGSKLKVRRSRRGRKLVCRVTASNAAGSTTASTPAARAH
jgi:hypothetical protein